VSLGIYFPGQCRSFCIIFYYGDRIYDAVRAELGAHIVQIGIAVATIAIGASVHWFKTKNLALFAIVEIAFGVASAFAISQGLPPSGGSLSQIAALAGTAFIVGRRLDNLAEGSRPLARSG
jgi:hypothetical protein